MRKLIIAVDCDDVLVPATEACVRIYNEKYGTSVQLKNAHDIHNMDWAAERSEILRRFSELWSTTDFASIPPFDEAVQACNRLARHHELYLVTGRHKDVLPTTNRMLERYFKGIFKEVEHIGLDGNKGDICRNFSAEVLIDDNLRHLNDARECGLENLIWFGDYAWNRSDKPEDDVIHCLDWLSVEQEIGRIAGS